LHRSLIARPSENEKAEDPKELYKSSSLMPAADTCTSLWRKQHKPTGGVLGKYFKKIILYY